MNRRQFVYGAATACVGIPRVLAAPKYDLIIKGGRVVDPARKLDAIRDVAIAEGRIAAIKAGDPGQRHAKLWMRAANWLCPA